MNAPLRTIAPVPVQIEGLTVSAARSLREEAAFRRIHPAELAARILEIVAKDDLFAAVLGEG